jgi:hypothetical protein
MTQALTTVALPAGSRVVDLGSTGHPLAWYQAVKDAGIAAVMLDAATPGVVADAQAALAAGLGVGLFQGYWPPAWKYIDYAEPRAAEIVRIAREIGLPAQATPRLPLFLDLEAVPAQVDSNDLRRWVSRWVETVAMAGYQAGIYEGANQGLDGTDFILLPKSYGPVVFWRSASDVPPISDGYVLEQQRWNQALNGVPVDYDQVTVNSAGQTLVVARRPWVPDDWGFMTRLVAQTVTVTHTVEQARLEAAALLDLVHQWEEATRGTRKETDES